MRERRGLSGFTPSCLLFPPDGLQHTLPFINHFTTLLVRSGTHIPFTATAHSTVVAVTHSLRSNWRADESHPRGPSTRCSNPVTLQSVWSVRRVTACGPGYQMFKIFPRIIPVYRSCDDYSYIKKGFLKSENRLSGWIRICFGKYCFDSARFSERVQFPHLYWWSRFRNLNYILCGQRGYSLLNY